MRFQSPRASAEEVELITRAWRVQDSQQVVLAPEAARASLADKVARERAEARRRVLDDNALEGEPVVWDYPIEDTSPVMSADFLLEEAGISAELVDALTAKVLERLSGPALAEMIAANLAALLNDEEK